MLVSAWLPAHAARDQRPFGYGVAIADPSPEPGHAFDLARQAGFDDAYAAVAWANIEPTPGRFAWQDDTSPNDLDVMLNAARLYDMHLIVRLDRPPTWAGAPAQVDPSELADMAGAVAERAQGVAVAYEIFNEPNLPYEWGGIPDPAGYAVSLAAAHDAIKAADPDALVIAAGLAPHTGGLGGSLEDVDFLNALYASGAKGSFDVLGTHPYGGTSAPDADPQECVICVRRAELYRQVMLDNDDASTPAWITEFGYLDTTDIDLGAYNWLKLAPDRQSDYLTSAFEYGYQNWSWLDGMVVFNLDFDTVPWNAPSTGAYWFALLNPDRTPRPAYTALQRMAKPGGRGE